MAKLKSSSPPSAADTFSIFVDTNLDTHFLISVSSKDTVSDLKGKLKSCHAFCFPSIGDINIQSVKVKHRGNYYHLVDSMHVIRAFNGIKGTWFLQVDAISACNQDRTVESAVNHDDGQSQKDQLLDSAPNACTLGSKAGGVYGFLMHGPSDENGLVQIDKNGEHEKQNLPDIHDDDLVPSNANANASCHLNLSSGGLLDGHHMSLTEHEKMTSGNVPGVRQHVEGDMPVESLGEHGTDKVLDKGEGNAREEHHGTTNEVDNDVFSVRKEKLEKSSNVVHNDPSFEKDGSSIERKKNKMEKDGSSEVPIWDPSVEYGSCKHSKKTSVAENIYPETYSLEKHEPGINTTGGAIYEENPTGGFCAPFDANTRNTRRNSRRKKSDRTKSELSSLQPRGQTIGGILEENAVLGESTVLENPAPEKSTVVSNPNGRSSHEKRKRKAKAQPPNIKSINEEPIHPLEKEATRDKPDEILEDKCEEDKADFIGEVAPPETLADDSIEKVIEGNTEVLLGLNHENSNTKTMQLMTQNEHAESSVADDHVEIPKSDTENINFIDFFIPKASQLEPHASVEEPPSMVTDTEKSHKEKHRRKRKPNMKLENSAYTLANPSCINEQQTSKTKTQDGDPGSHGLDVPVLHHLVEEPKAKKPHKKRSTDIRKTDVQCGDTSSALGEIQHLHDESMLKKKPFHSNGTQVQLPVSKDKHSKRHKAKTASISESENKRVPYLDENVNINTMDANLASAKSSPVAVTENPFSSCAGISMKETMADLVASGDSTEEETPTQMTKYQIVLRKPPSKKSGENLSKTSHQKSLIATSSTIFNGSMSETSEDEIDKQATSKALSYNSSTSTNSDEDFEETLMPRSLKPHVHMKFPGVGSSSHSKDDGSDGIILTQPSSEVKKSSMSLSKILRSTNSYKKARATALQSQSQPEDSQSQPVDVVMETQPTSP